MTGVQLLEGAGTFSPCHHVETGIGAHPAAYPMGTGTISLGIKRPGREADHFHLVSMLIMHDDIPQLPHTSSWHGA